MARQVKYTLTIHRDARATDLLELCDHIAELADMVPEWCVERDAVCKTIAETMSRLVAVYSNDD